MSEIPAQAEEQSTCDCLRRRTKLNCGTGCLTVPLNEGDRRPGNFSRTDSNGPVVLSLSPEIAGSFVGSAKKMAPEYERRRSLGTSMRRSCRLKKSVPQNGLLDCCDPEGVQDLMACSQRDG